jgi:hypothetical protein
MSEATRTPPSYEVICQHYQVLSRRLMKGVRHPDGDFCHTVFVEDEAGTDFAPIEPDIIQGQALKEHFFTVVLPAILRRSRARMFGLLMPGWWVPPDKLNTEEKRALFDEYCNAGGKLANHPDREEIAALTVCDGDRLDTYLANVKRRPGQRPRYGPWVQMDTETEGRPCGLMVDDLRTALQDVRAEMWEANDG